MCIYKNDINILKKQIRYNKKNKNKFHYNQ